jgi:uncharacterized protein (UPF0332 family)
MSFEPDSLINISKELQTTGTTEAYYRSAINRAYYGVFGYLKKRLSILTIGQSVHQEVIRSLSDSPKLNEKKAGKKLEGLFKKRNEADYNFSSEIKANNSEFSIKEAEKIIELFNEEEEEI